MSVPRLLLFVAYLVAAYAFSRFVVYVDRSFLEQFFDVLVCSVLLTV